MSTNTSTCHVTSIVENLKQHAQVIGTFVDLCDDSGAAGQAGSRGRRTMTRLNEVIQELEELRSILARPMPVEIVNALTFQNEPELNEVFGQNMDQRMTTGFDAILENAVEALRELSKAKMKSTQAAMQERMKKLKGKDAPMGILDMQQGYALGTAGILGKLAESFQELAKSAHSALGLVMVQNILEVMTHQQPVICPFPPVGNDGQPNPNAPAVEIDPPLITIPTPVDDYEPNPNAPVVNPPAVEIDPPLITIPSPVDESRLAPPQVPVNWCGTTVPGAKSLTDVDTTGGEPAASSEESEADRAARIAALEEWADHSKR